MADCITHALRYRKNIVEEKDVAQLFNATMKEAVEKSKAAGENKGKGAAAGAIVFASADPNGIEFALVNDYGMKGWDIQKDTRVLLSFMDPVGVVALGAGLDEKEGLFRTFKGKEWAQEHAAAIIEQAENSLPMYTFVGAKPLATVKVKTKKKKREVAV